MHLRRASVQRPLCDLPLRSPTTIRDRASRRRRRRRRLGLEPLEDRRLLAAATDLAALAGLVFDDQTGNGYDAGEEVAGATVNLYRDNGDGVFQPEADTLFGTTTTDATGRYRFDALTAGGYFAQQPAQTVGADALQQQISPLITVSPTDVAGQLATMIDSFDTTTQAVIDTTGDGVPVTSSVAAPEAIGGERDLVVNKTSINGSVQISVNDPLLPGLLTFDSILTGQGTRSVSWDGADGAPLTIDDTGLAGTDITSGGTALGLRLQTGADLAGGTATIRIYSDDGVAETSDRFSSAVFEIPATGGAPTALEYVPFTAFTPTSGGGADLTQIGAIEMEITGAANVNGAAELVGAVGSTVLTQDFANFETADLRLIKSVDDFTPTIGQNVRYTLTITNAGPDSASGVTVAEQLPAGIAFVSATASQGSYDNATGTWQVGTLDNAAAATLQIVATVVTEGAKTNTAEITASGAFDPDSTPGNDVAGEDDQAAVTITPELVDLALTKSASDTTPNVGQNVTFTINVANAGPSDATGVAVTDSLPDGLTFVSASADQGSFDQATGVWTVGTIASGASAGLQVVAQVTAAGTLANTAEISAADQFDVDSTPGNGVADEDDQATATVVPPVVDLSLQKVVDDASPEVGENVTFTVSIANAGPDAASGVTVGDALPAGVTLVESLPSQGDYDAASGIWTVGSLASGAAATLQIVVRIDAPGEKLNVAEVLAADQFDVDSTPGNDAADEDDRASVSVVPAAADLSLEKTVDDPTPGVGQDVTFTVVVSNSGPDSASGVSVRDALPAGTSFVASDPSQGDYDAATGIWTVGALASGASATLRVTATADTVGTLVNTAEVATSDQADPDSTPGNDVADEDDQAAVTITPELVDLALTKSASDTTPNVGQNVTFTMNVANAGPSDATGVAVTDSLPDGLTFVSAAADQGSFDQATGVWTVGTIPSGASAGLQVVAQVTAAGTLANTAEISAADQFDVDSTPGNGVADEDDQATATVVPPVVDLSLQKVVDDASPEVGENVTFTVSIANAGPDAASGVTVVDTLPAGVTLVESLPSQGDYDAASGIWTVGSLASGATATLQIVVSVDSPGVKTNVAQVETADQFDPDSTPGNDVANEDDQAGVSVIPNVIDLSLTKTADTDRPNLGEELTYTLTLSNAGPDAASGVTVADALPAGVTLVESLPSQGDYDAASGIWTVGSLASGAAATLQIVVRIDAPGEKLNVAEVLAADQFDVDSTPGNDAADEDDRASVSVVPAAADLSLEKTVDDPTPGVGQNVTFTVVVSNSGPDSASGVSVRDALPAGTSFVASDPSQGDYDAATGIWTVGALASGASATLRVTAMADSVGTLVNTAEVATSDQADPDSTPGNDVADEDDQAAVTITPELVDLALTKVLDDLDPTVGQQITYTLSLNNAGPSTATGVVIRDTLPAGVSIVATDPSQGSFDGVTGIWTVGDVSVDATATLQITAIVGNIGDATNVAEVVAIDQPDADSVPGNGDPDEDDQASVSFTTQRADLSVGIVADDETPALGDSVTLEYSIANAGPADASGVAARIDLPDGWSVLSAVPDAGTFDPATGEWALAALGAGQTRTLRVVVRVDTFGFQPTGIEVIAADQFDPDSTPGNASPSEDDQATLVIQAPRRLSLRLFMAR